MEENTTQALNSRLIVKCIPYCNDDRLKAHVTNAKLIYKNNKSRKFAYVGFSSIEEAKLAREYFNNTYIDAA